MLLKTNSFDKKFMKLALSLASERIGLTGENPSVGCVIVKDNEIISTGQTGYHGRPHAEINAIKSCKKNLKGSSIYIIDHNDEKIKKHYVTLDKLNLISNYGTQKQYKHPNLYKHIYIKPKKNDKGPLV